ncbi:hypothetical protein ABBQ32_14185 [Trebouxia sp. C0010 RCD-2024]
MSCLGTTVEGNDRILSNTEHEGSSQCCMLHPRVETAMRQGNKRNAALMDSMQMSKMGTHHAHSRPSMTLQHDQQPQALQSWEFLWRDCKAACRPQQLGMQALNASLMTASFVFYSTSAGHISSLP